MRRSAPALSSRCPQAAAKALEHWRSTLDAGECRMLLEQFQQLTGDENERLRGWLRRRRQDAPPVYGGGWEVLKNDR